MSCRARSSARWIAAWGFLGVAIPACGLLSFGTESGNPTDHDMPDVPTIDDGDGVPPDRSMDVPGIASTATLANPGVSAPGATDSAGVPAPTTDAPSMPQPSLDPAATGAPAPGVASLVPSNNPPAPPTDTRGSAASPPTSSPTSAMPGTAGCDLAACQQMASNDAARLAAASSAPVPVFEDAECGLVGEAPGCTCTPADGQVTSLAGSGECALEGRFGCLLAASEVPTCEPDTDAGAATCQGPCEQAADALAADRARSYTVEVLNASCSSGECTYLFRVDSAACFEGPLLDPVACP